MAQSLKFKISLFKNVSKQLGIEYQVYMPPYHPQSNSRIKGLYHFLKACISKHVLKTLEWDKVI